MPDKITDKEKAAHYEMELYTCKKRRDKAEAELQAMRERAGVDRIRLKILKVLEANPMRNILDELPKYMSTILPAKLSKAISDDIMGSNPRN